MKEMIRHILKINFGMNPQRAVLVILIAAICSIFFPAMADSTQDQIAAIKAKKNEAIFEVQHIVNQPVKHLKRTPDMHVAVYSPGWFHDGAFEPGFDHVDIRQTQDLKYGNDQYVTSDLNPGEVFLGAELEFNPMTKYFYTDRSVPKKKLTEDEMLRINALYRVIGQCDAQLDDLAHPEPFYYKIHDFAVAHKRGVISGVVILLLALIAIQRRRSCGAG